MSYSQIFRRIGRLFQSSVNSMLSDAESEKQHDFDEELRRAEQEANRASQEERTSQKDESKEKEHRSHKRQAGSQSSGQRRPGERDDAFYLAVLGLTPSASNDEVRKAYRKLMGQYHPDRVANLGPELQKTAAEKSKEINEAYMIIERRRGMK